jgi:ferritin
MKIWSSLLSPAILKLLQYRIQQEEQSSRVYLAMTMWLSDNGYLGAAKLFEKYSHEELVHAGKARDMILAHGFQPMTPALVAPQETFAGLPEIVRLWYDHEVVITEQCQELSKAAFAEHNYMVAELGMWYCKEQVEELDKFQNWIDRLSAFGEEKDVLRMLDEEMWDAV